MFNLSDTICAICTPPGTGSITAIRISGHDSWDITKKIFTKNKTEDELQTPILFTHMQALHGFIKDPDNDKVLDEVVLLPFKSPQSYTCEDTIEIFCHGNTHIASTILALCLKNGARRAKAGEFTFRAFTNGRLDLTEAEAVNELIHADSARSIQAASNILQGSLKEKVKLFREELFNLITVIESAIEFPQDVAPIQSNEIVTELNQIKFNIDNLIERAKEGQLLREGIKISIIGTPNVGKSSLLNQLLENQRAIVTNEPGTTRDTLEEKIIIDGWTVVLVDTAGIRHEANLNESEKLGIERSRSALEISDLALILFDITKDLANYTEQLSILSNGKPKIIIGNKIDLLTEQTEKTNQYDIAISAKYGTNIDKLKELISKKIKSLCNTKTNHLANPIYINQRQKELLIQCNSSLGFALDLARQNVTEDIIADELKKAVSKLDEIAGRIINEDIISNIFTKFCIGK